MKFLPVFLLFVCNTVFAQHQITAYFDYNTNPESEIYNFGGTLAYEYETDNFIGHIGVQTFYPVIEATEQRHLNVNFQPEIFAGINWISLLNESLFEPLPKFYRLYTTLGASYNTLSEETQLPANIFVSLNDGRFKVDIGMRRNLVRSQKWQVPRTLAFGRFAYFFRFKKEDTVPDYWAW